MNATNAATSVDEKCHFKHVHAAWAIKDCVCVHGGFWALCVQNLAQSEEWLCWHGRVSRVCLHNAEAV